MIPDPQHTNDCLPLGCRLREARAAYHVSLYCTWLAANKLMPVGDLFWRVNRVICFTHHFQAPLDFRKPVQLTGYTKFFLGYRESLFVWDIPDIAHFFLAFRANDQKPDLIIGAPPVLLYVDVILMHINVISLHLLPPRGVSLILLPASF